MLQALLDAQGTRRALLLAGLSGGVLVLTLIVAVLVVALLPKDYFVRSRRRASTPGQVLGTIGKNMAGAVLLAGGIGLSLPAIPGPGFAILLLGLFLLDLPGKQRLQRRLVRRRRVSATLNWLRARLGKPKFDLPEPVEHRA